MFKIKIIILFFMSFVLSQKMISQSFDDGTNLISIGFGLPPSYLINKDYDRFKHYTDYKYKNYGTVVLKYEHGLHKYFGIGINTEYSGSSANYSYDDYANAVSPRYLVSINSNSFGIFGRMNGHLPITDNIDFYGGVGLGYTYTVNKYSDTNPNVSTNYKRKETIFDFAWQFTIGGRYMVKDNVGVFGELGGTYEYGSAARMGQLGLVLKF